MRLPESLDLSSQPSKTLMASRRQSSSVPDASDCASGRALSSAMGVVFIGEDEDIILLVAGGSNSESFQVTSSVGRLQCQKEVAEYYLV